MINEVLKIDDADLLKKTKSFDHENVHTFFDCLNRVAQQ